MAATVEKATVRKLGARNQITLPPEFLDKYHLQKGDHVAVIEQDGLFILSPLDVKRKDVAARLKGGVEIGRI